MPKPFPAEFRRDVIAVARKGEASIAQVARDFGISESCLQRWLKIADREDGITGPAGGDCGSGANDESAELRELRRRNKLLEQENEILRRATAYCSLRRPPPPPTSQLKSGQSQTTHAHTATAHARAQDESITWLSLGEGSPIQS